MRNSIIKDVSNYLGYDIKTIRNIAYKAPKTYRRYLIEKKKGGKRLIEHPSKQTKSLQYAIMELFLSKVTCHSAAMGFIRHKKSPLLMNAKQHSNFAYSVHLDIQDFFHSIHPEDLCRILNSKIFVEKNINEDERIFLQNALFISNAKHGFRLGVGAPSSPIISNIVMIEIDQFLASFANRKSGVYTRYADDMVYSTNLKGECVEFLENVENILEDTSSPTLRLNDKKTFFMSKGTRRTVTGLYITPNGNISIGRKKKRYLRKLIFDFKNGRLQDKEIKYLQGYLAFVLDVEPNLYNRLAIKYGGHIVREALNFRGNV